MRYGSQRVYLATSLQDPSSPTIAEVEAAMDVTDHLASPATVHADHSGATWSAEFLLSDETFPVWELLRSWTPLWLIATSSLANPAPPARVGDRCAVAGIEVDQFTAIDTALAPDGKGRLTQGTWRAFGPVVEYHPRAEIQPDHRYVWIVQGDESYEATPVHGVYSTAELAMAAHPADWTLHPDGEWLVYEANTRHGQLSLWRCTVDEPESGR